MKTANRNWIFLVLLILAGESVFILPFVLARVFRPAILVAFELNNVELGQCFSIYGIIALGAYLLGGPIADKYPPRKLIAIALWMTSVGGFYYSSFPSIMNLRLLYGYWGFTTIFIFWAPMIKATRLWGGIKSQGKAFGFLDGGRGLVGALFGSLGVLIFTILIPTEGADISLETSRHAMRTVILTASTIVSIVGILVWFFLKTNDSSQEEDISINQIRWTEIREVLKLKSVWLLMLMILCAYFGYKATDVFSLYAQDVMLYNQVESAKVGTFLLAIRPVAGIAIGIIADRSKTSFWLLISFILTLAGSLLFATKLLEGSSPILFALSILIIASGVYASRALYFAVMEMGKIPLVLTGTAVGLISLVGYTPDIFSGPIIGYFLDGTPGVGGHQSVFTLLSVFSLLGAIAAFIYHRSYGKITV